MGGTKCRVRAGARCSLTGAEPEQVMEAVVGRGILFQVQRETAEKRKQSGSRRCPTRSEHAVHSGENGLSQGGGREQGGQEDAVRGTEAWSGGREGSQSQEVEGTVWIGGYLDLELRGLVDG